MNSILKVNYFSLWMNFVDARNGWFCREIYVKYRWVEGRVEIVNIIFMGWDDFCIFKVLEYLCDSI